MSKIDRTKVYGVTTAEVIEKGVEYLDKSLYPIKADFEDKLRTIEVSELFPNQVVILVPADKYLDKTDGQYYAKNYRVAYYNCDDNDETWELWRELWKKDNGTYFYPTLDYKPYIQDRGGVDMGFTSDRANHSLTVAKQMYEMALERTGDEFYARKMFHLGLVHDIGYQFTDNNKEHAHIGGEFLREEGYEYWKEVYDHGNPDLLERPSDEWFLLNLADMKTDSKGNRVTMDERLKDIGDRYGYESQEYLTARDLARSI